MNLSREINVHISNTRSHDLYSIAPAMGPQLKRKRNALVDEITFDPAARQEYLTGFHKRKVQRIENAKDQAAKREKEERVRERRQV